MGFDDCGRTVDERVGKETVMELVTLEQAELATVRSTIEFDLRPQKMDLRRSELETLDRQSS